MIFLCFFFKVQGETKRIKNPFNFFFFLFTQQQTSNNNSWWTVKEARMVVSKQVYRNEILSTVRFAHWIIKIVAWRRGNLPVHSWKLKASMHPRYSVHRALHFPRDKGMKRRVERRLNATRSTLSVSLIGKSWIRHDPRNRISRTCDGYSVLSRNIEENSD